MVHVARRDGALRARIVESFRLEGVRAGSALVEAGGRLLLVQDDALSIVWLTPRAGAPPAVRPMILEGHGGPLPKPEKPDFEAAFLAPGGALYVLGSGSTPRRRRIARIDVATEQAALVPADALYDALAAALGETPNLEGAVLLGDVVRLFHRGAGPVAGASATVDVPAEALDGGAPRILATARWDLGALPYAAAPGEAPRRVLLSFTDAAPGPAGRIHWLAAAEDTPNAIDDGPVVGAALGVMSGDDARWAPIEEANGATSVRKAEGLALSPDGASAFVVTDPDDALAPAELCRVVLEGPW